MAIHYTEESITQINFNLNPNKINIMIHEENTVITNESLNDDDLECFNLDLKKKKKKKKVVPIQEDSSEPSDEKHFDDQQEYEYTYLLDRLYQNLYENNPSLMSRKKKVIPPPNVIGFGSKKSLWSNFATITNMLNRHIEHIQSFIISELDCKCTVDGTSSLVLRGKFAGKHIEKILKKYIIEYVACQTCLSHETTLIRDPITRLYFMNCALCKSSRSVAPIKLNINHT
jgi:translation initiation factor 2 subunit 2